MATFDFNNNDKVIAQHYGWNHPELGDIEPQNCDFAAIEILDPNKTLEQQLEVQVGIRQMVESTFPPLDEEVASRLNISEIKIPGLLEDDPEIRTVILEPKNRSKKALPCILYFFGGGMIMGSPEMQMEEEAALADQIGCVVVTPEYRLLPKYTYPCAVNDGEATLNYILAHADELGIDPNRIVLVGQSGGGYMSACVAQRVKRRTDVKLAGQVLLYPVIDDTFQFESSKLFYGEIWHASDDQKMFNALLGTDYFRGAAPDDCIPSHCTDFKGLPPTVLYSGDLDYGHDACIKYCQGIMNEHIFCDMHVWGGCFHGFLGMTYGTDLHEWVWDCYVRDIKLLLTGKCVRN